jgi:AsmA protein
MLKKILIGFAVLLVLVIAAVVVVVATVDVDHYKPQIEQAAHDKLDRALKFDGKLSLSLFPTIAVALPHTTLSERGSDAPFLSLDRARVSLAVLPLLSGRVEAGTASLYGLRATIVRRADGTANVDDLTGGPAPKAQAEETRPPASGGQMPAFELGGIELVDAQVEYRDERAHNTVTVSKLNLKTGRIGTRGSTPVDLSATVTATEPPSSVDLTLKTIADADLAAHAFGVRDLDAHARGHSGADQFDVALSAPKITLDPQRAAGDLVKLAATVSGGHQARAELALQSLAGTGEKISVGRMALDLDAAQGPQKVSAHLASPLQIAVTAQKIELPKLNGEVDLESPTLPQKSLKVNLDGSVSVDAHAQDVAARLGAQFDETHASTRVDVHGFSAPRIGFDVDIDRLNLDRYVPAAAAPAPAAESGKAAPAPAAAPAADPKIDLSALKALNLAGEARIGALQAHNMKAAKVKVGVHAAGGHLDVAPLAANLYQGTLNGAAKVDADGNRIGVNATLDGISIEPLLKDLIGKSLLEGHGGVKLNVTTAGPTAGAMRRALAGTASLALRDGAVHGINIAQKLRDLKATLSTGSVQTQPASSAEKTDFSELSGSFSIKNGVATNSDLLAKSPLLRVNGAGTIDIGAGALDYTVQAAVVGTLAGQGGADLSSLRGVTLPVHLSGPFTALSYQLDWGSLARQAVKTKAAEQIKNLLGNKLRQDGQSPAPNLGDTLKNLLGKPPGSN